jgi:beta-glucosidase
MPTAKHYLADGGTEYVGKGQYLIDRGDAKMSEQEMRSVFLEPYKAQIKAGVRIIMVSFSSYNGVKMTANKQLLTDVLKKELGFSGIVVSDWEATHELSGGSFEKNIVIAVNAGIDMFMEPYQYADTIDAIVKYTKYNEISKERIDDAVTRILTVKMELGLFDDPYQKNTKHEVTELGSQQYRDLAKQLVEKSLVLLKNKGNVLPLKKNQKVFVTGPAVNNIGVQCGGWTFGWQGNMDQGGEKSVPGTTILEGLQQYAKQYNLTIITDPAKAGEADVTVLAVGEKPYAEYEGDSPDISLTGKTSLDGNADAIKLAKKLGKPTVA